MESIRINRVGAVLLISSVPSKVPQSIPCQLGISSCFRLKENTIGAAKERKTFMGNADEQKLQGLSFLDVSCSN